jgi:hypothetical protein
VLILYFKLVVCAFNALITAISHNLPITKVRNLTRFFIYGGNNIELESEALIDPECSFREMFLCPTMGKFTTKQISIVSDALKRNRTISSVEIKSEELEYTNEVEHMIMWNTNWFFDGLANNEYPVISSLLIENVVVDWDMEPVFRSLKTNVSLKSLEIVAYLTIDTCQLCQALEINDSLTALDLETNFAKLDTALLAKTIEAKRRIKVLRINYSYNIIEPAIKLIGSLREVHFQTKDITPATFKEIFEELERSKTIVKFSFGSSTLSFPKTELNSLVESLFEVNRTLIEFQIWAGDVDMKKDEVINQKCQRNRQYQKQRHDNIAMIAFNIGRSKEALALLPREVWLQIFSFVESALGYDYCAMLNALFKDYSVRKVAICP